MGITQKNMDLNSIIPKSGMFQTVDEFRNERMKKLNAIAEENKQLKKEIIVSPELAVTNDQGIKTNNESILLLSEIIKAYETDNQFILKLLITEAKKLV